MDQLVLTQTVGMLFSAAATFIAAVLTWRFQRKKRDDDAYRERREAEEAAERAEARAEREGVRGLLRSAIFDGHAKCEAKGYATATDKEIIQRNFDAYAALGGNGVAKALYMEVMELPTNVKGE